MKYLMTMVFAVLTMVSVMGQDKTAEDLKKEGDIAVEAKDLAKGLTMYEQAMAKGGLESDGALYFNAAYCARKIKKYDKAIKYYSKSESLNYKADMACYYEAICNKELDKGADAEKILVSGISKYSKSKYINHMKKALVDYYLAEGAVPFNEGNSILGTPYQTKEEFDAIIAKANIKFNEAKPWFEKAAKYAPNDEKVTSTLSDINKRLSGEN